jgi:hypothetical protein
MKAEAWTPSTEDLRQLGEHLFYEVEMLYRLPHLILQSPGLYAQDARNALIEGFTIHVRQLIDFFWPQHARRMKDILASDYYDPGRWDEIRPERPEILSEALRRKIGWGVMHLTYDRAWSRPEEKGWDFIGLARALGPVVICFVDAVDHDLLDPKHPPAVMKAYAEAFLAGTPDPERTAAVTTASS